MLFFFLQTKFQLGKRKSKNLLITHKAIRKLHGLNVKLELSWVPGEIGVDFKGSLFLPFQSPGAELEWSLETDHWVFG